MNRNQSGAEQRGDVGDTPDGVSRRTLLNAVGVALLTGALEACTSQGDVPTQPSSSTLEPSAPTVSPSPEVISQDEQLLLQTAEVLLAMGEKVDEKTLRFKSAIQSPNYQTDIDVGAAGVGKAFVAMARARKEDTRWRDAAVKTANWLQAVAIKDENGLSWPDYNNGDGHVANEQYTSYDDGALGVGDFFWEMYELTGGEEYKYTALQSVAWVLSKAERVATASGKNGYRWKWDVNSGEEDYQMGMGEGVVGIVQTLTTYHARVKSSDPQLAAIYKTYIDGAVAFIQDRQQLLQNEHEGDARALPETDTSVDADGNTNMNAGYLSGAAGLAYMHLTLHNEFNDQAYLEHAKATLDWLSDAKNGPFVHINDKEVAWKLALDPEGGDDAQLATGFEEGAAGIGWVFLQAYHATKEGTYLKMATQAGNWLLHTAQKQNGGLVWNEDLRPTNPIVHGNLNNGAAGIAMFLEDIYRTTGNKVYRQGAEGAMRWLAATATLDPTNHTIQWADNDGDADYQNDPSMHWGVAGLLVARLHMLGNGQDAPGLHPALEIPRK